MLWTKVTLKVFEFHLGRIVGQGESSLSHCKIAENVSIPLSIFNRVTVKFNRECKKCTTSHAGHPGPSDRALRLVKRNVRNNPR